MTTDQLKEASALLSQIEATLSDVAAYREAEDIEIGLQPERRGAGRFLDLKHRITLTSGEIAGYVVMALEAHVATMRARLQELGVE